MKYWREILIGALAVFILLYIFGPVGPSEKIEKMKSERDMYKVLSESLEAEKNSLNSSIDSLQIEIETKRDGWLIEDRENEERNSVTIPKERDKVISSPVPDQLEWWENKRARARR